MADWTTLGPYIAGEKPEPWVHQFLDADGAVINLTGYSVRVTYKVDGGTQVVVTGTLSDAANGKAQYQWVASDIATAGEMAGELTVGNATFRYARAFRMLIVAPRGGALPNI